MGHSKEIPLSADALRGMVGRGLRGGEKGWAAAQRKYLSAFATRRRPYSPLPRPTPPFRCERSERRNPLKSHLAQCKEVPLCAGALRGMVRRNPKTKKRRGTPRPQFSILNSQFSTKAFSPVRKRTMKV